jgi:hypothetical protein
MFITRSVPKWPCISIAVMSGWLKWICFHAFDSRLVLIRMTDLIWSGYFSCVVGYITAQFWLARVLPLTSMYGS